MSSLSLAACGILTSEQLIQILKRNESLSDSLSSNAKSAPKIEILRSAWADDTMYVPRKVELILDCTLDIMTSSAKVGPRIEPKYLEADYWELLLQVLSTVSGDSDFLHAIVSRHNVLTLVSALSEEPSADAWRKAVPVLTILLPACIRRIGASQIDAVNACFRDLIKVMAHVDLASMVETCTHMWEAVCKPWASDLALGSNARKSAKFFVAESLLPYATARIHTDTTYLAELLDHVAGMSLYGPLALEFKASASAIPDSVDLLTSSLCELLPSHPAYDAVLAPLLLHLVKHTSAMHSHAPPAIIRHGALERCLVPLASALLALPDKVPTLLSLVQAIDQSGLYQPGGDDQDTWTALWTKILAYTLRDMHATPAGRDTSFSLLHTLWRLCPEEVAHHLTTVWTHTARLSVKMPAFNTALALAHAVLARVSQERRLPWLLDTLCEACESVNKPLSELMQSPILCVQSARAWEESLTKHATIEQAHAMMLDMLSKVRSAQSSMTVCMTYLLCLLVPSFTPLGDQRALLADWAASCMNASDSLVVSVGLELHVRLVQCGYCITFLPRERLSAYLSDARCDPVLRLSSFRALCCEAEVTGTPPPWNEDALIDLLLAGLRTDMAPSTWDGQVLGLTETDQAPVALWRLITTRWLHVIEQMASDALLDHLVAFMAQTLDAHGMLRTVSALLLRNAQFFEQKRWQAAVLRYARVSLSGKDALRTVRILTRVPVEYVTRPVVLELAPFFWQLDQSRVQDAELKQLLFRWLQAHPHTASFATPLAAYVDALLKLPQAYLNGAHETMCLSLLRAMLPHAKEAPLPIDDWMSLAAASKPSPMRHMARCALAELLPFAVDNSISAWMPTLAPSVESAIAQIHSDMSFESARELALLFRILAAHLRAHPQSMAPLLQAVDALCSSATPHLAPLAPALLSCIMSVAPDKGRFMHMVCAFAMLSSTFAQTSDDLIPQLVAVIETMEVDAYGSTLNALTSLFHTDTTCTLSELVSFLQVIALMFQHAPPRSSRASDKCFSHLVLSLGPMAMHFPTLTKPIVEVLVCVCQYRPHMLRPFDVPRILALLGILLGPRLAQPVDEHDASAIFGGICGVLRSLIRHRKDLIKPCLPHLTEILSQQWRLLSHVSSAHTGMAIERQIHASMPCWLNMVVSPLGLDAAQALRRVLSELAGKTSVIHVSKKAKPHTPNMNETLAKSMTKHAVYILVAYARCVTMPHTTIAPNLRQEILPGLFALCDICGDFERDAALKSMLDASAQLVFKDIWRQWDAQRYKGA